MPAMLKNRPAVQLAGVDEAIAAVERDVDRASGGCHGTPSSAAKPLPDPAGTMPSAEAVPATTLPISLMVPSPPQARTVRAPCATAIAASSAA